MPTVVGPYEVTRKIGEGGYGKIFLARRLARRVGRAIDDYEVVLKQVKLPTKKLEREMCLSLDATAVINETKEDAELNLRQCMTMVLSFIKH